MPETTRRAGTPSKVVDRGRELTGSGGVNY